MPDNQQSNLPPEWAFEFHGHRCPFMPLGFRMGKAALAELGVSREPDHTLHVIAELGEGHPQTCLLDGIQIATGATFGKTLIEKTNWGKLAATFWHPGKTAVRFALRADFLDRFGRQEFFAYRKRGLEPSMIPAGATQAAIDWTLSLADDEIFSVTKRPDFSYTPPEGSFNKHVCAACGEYVFERYVRLKDGKFYFIPCAGYGGQRGEASPK